MTRLGRPQLDLSSAKCLADQVLLYLRYGLDKIVKYRNYYSRDKLAPDELARRRLLFEELADHIYNEHVRGEMINRMPRTVASEIIYHAACLSQLPVSQMDISEILGVATVSLQRVYMEPFLIDFKLVTKDFSRRRPRPGRHYLNVYYDHIAECCKIKKQSAAC